jgi:predicted metalloendopeptidase
VLLRLYAGVGFSQAKVDGKSTESENIADHGGLKVALQTLKVLVVQKYEYLCTTDALSDAQVQILALTRHSKDHLSSHNLPPPLRA